VVFFQKTQIVKVVCGLDFPVVDGGRGKLLDIYKPMVKKWIDCLVGN
jgi:hypothetical protein